MSFSALQRAENFSIACGEPNLLNIPRFQCSSASRKFLNFYRLYVYHTVEEFQCSSASRKFLNATSVPRRVTISQFQCSSASRKFLNLLPHLSTVTKSSVSVLFSEPKISQFDEDVPASARVAGFSALQRAENFSMIQRQAMNHPCQGFQCSSASRKFLNLDERRSGLCRRTRFQCSSASRKFLNRRLLPGSI